MKRISFAIILICLAGILLSACGGSSMVVDEAMNGQTVKVKVGDTISLQIAGNITTGYSWQVAEIDTTILQQVGDPDYKTDSSLTGAGGMYTFKFKAVYGGTTTLKLNYLRTYETNTAPIKTYDLTVEVLMPE